MDGLLTFYGILIASGYGSVTRRHMYWSVDNDVHNEIISGKPIHFGYNVWSLTSSSGYMYHMEPYCGTHTLLPETGLSQGPSVIIGLAEQAQVSQGCKFFHDNLFTTLSLMDEMTKRGYGSSGTMRQNRLFDVPFTPLTAFMKLPRGTSKVLCQGEKLLVRWKDNSIVTVATNMEEKYSETSVKRWNRHRRVFDNVQQPKCISRYNEHMGSVDLHNLQVSRYYVSPRSSATTAKPLRQLATPATSPSIPTPIISHGSVHQLAPAPFAFPSLASLASARHHQPSHRCVCSANHHPLPNSTNQPSSLLPLSPRSASFRSKADCRLLMRATAYRVGPGVILVDASQVGPGAVLLQGDDEGVMRPDNHREAAVIVARDFNSANLRKVMPELRQHIAFPTRGDTTLDHCYSPFRDGYAAKTHLPFGRPDLHTPPAQRLGDAEQRIGEVETFGAEVQEVLTEMQKTQLELKSKIAELEGHSRRKNIRIYGIKEGAEGTSMLNFVENFIKTELGESTGLNELGIERAHRAAGPKLAETAPPRSTVVRFLKYTTKEQIISVAWRKRITLDGNRVFFDHDYATGVMEKSRDYMSIQKVLKEEGIRFHTPMTEMRVFLESGTVTYESTDQAAQDLRARGLPILPRPEGRRREALRPSPRWEKARSKRHGAGGEYQQRIRDKLRGFNRLAETDNEDSQPIVFPCLFT
nr:PREDICTED: uncharacterized protein LOC103355262 [Stegastes partitus]